MLQQLTDFDIVNEYLPKWNNIPSDVVSSLWPAKRLFTVPYADALTALGTKARFHKTPTENMQALAHRIRTMEAEHPELPTLFELI